MRVLKYIFIMVILFFTSILSFLYFADIDYSVDVQEIMIQNKVESFIPYKTSSKVPIKLLKKDVDIDIHINTAKVDFLDTGRIQVVSNFIVYKEDTYLEGEITVLSKIKYIDGDFYLTNIDVFSMDTGELNISEKDKEKIENIKSNVSLLGKLFTKKFGVEIPNADILEKGVQNKILDNKDEIIENIKARVRQKMIAFTKDRPVYTIKKEGFRNQLARLAIDDVVIKENVLTVKINSSTFVKNVF